MRLAERGWAMHIQDGWGMWIVLLSPVEQRMRVEPRLTAQRRDWPGERVVAMEVWCGSKEREERSRREGPSGLMACNVARAS